MSNTTAAWENSLLQRVFTIVRGTITPNKYPEENLDYYSIPVFDQTGGSTTVQGCEIESNKTLINEPSILVSKLNPRKPRVQVTKERIGLRQCASTEYIAYAPCQRDTSLKFYKYYFESEFFSKRLERAATGSTNSHVRVTPSETLRWKIPYPPIKEQQKIATILSSVDDVIEKTRAQIDKLKDLKSGMMQELLTQGIGHTEFKDSAVGRIPVIWQVKTLEELVKPEKPITYGIVQAGPHCEGGIPYIRVSDMTKRELTLDKMLRTSPAIAEKYRRSSVSSGDIIYALRGVVGRVQTVPSFLHGANLTQGTARISSNDQVSSQYLVWAMRAPYVQKQAELEAKGSTFQEVTLTRLRKMQVAVAPWEEQARIVSVMDSIERELVTVERKEAQLGCLKKALMQDLLTGKVRVNVDQKESEVA